MMKLEDYIKPTQKELFSMMRKVYKGKAVSRLGSYVLVKGDAPVMLLAHMDTVHKERVKQICMTPNGNVLMSPQGIGGDDRCGVYALNKVYALSKVKPWLLFTCDEEIGCVGAEEFCRQHTMGKLPDGLDGLKCLIEIDRKGKDDAVYYDCENKDFEEYITGKGFKTEWGTCSDISYVAPELGVAAVNLSSGYYNQHTQHEYIVRSQIEATVKRVVEIVKDAAGTDFPKYEYVERSLGGRGWYDDFFDWYGADIPADVPEEIRGMYKELLDVYPMSELEYYREAHGNEVIQLIYEADMGISSEAEAKLDALMAEADAALK